MHSRPGRHPTEVRESSRHFSFGHSWQEGKTAKFKSITEIKDADTLNFSLFMVDKDGKEQPMVKITYKRKK